MDRDFSFEDQIDRIVTLVASYPEIASRVAMRFISDEGKLPHFSLFCECVGMESARVLFDALPEYAWRLIDRPEATRAMPSISRALEVLHSELLAACLEQPEPNPAALGTNDPFAFLSTLNSERRLALLRSEPVERIALMAAFRTHAGIRSLADYVAPEHRRQLVVALSRIHRLPSVVIRQQAQRFADELRVRAAAPQPPPFRKQREAVPETSDFDTALAGINVDRELEIRLQASLESQELDEFLQSIPSADSIRSAVLLARQKNRTL